MEKTSVVTGLSFIHNFQDSLCLSKVFNLYANVECSYIQLYFPQVRFFSGHTTKQDLQPFYPLSATILCKIRYGTLSHRSPLANICNFPPSSNCGVNL